MLMRYDTIAQCVVGLVGICLAADKAECRGMSE